MIEEFRFQIMYGNMHSLSYMIDPRYFKARLPRGNHFQVEYILFIFPADNEPQVFFNDGRTQTICMQ